MISDLLLSTPIMPDDWRMFCSFVLLVSSYLAVSHLLMLGTVLVRWPHWFWRALLLMGWIALPLLNDADDVALFLFCGACALLPGVALIAWRTRHYEEHPRFSLRDLAFVVTLLGVTLALALAIKPTWPPVVFVVFGGWQVTLLLSGVVAVLAHRWRWKVVGLVTFVALAAGGVLAISEQPWLAEQYSLEGSLTWANVRSGRSPGLDFTLLFVVSSMVSCCLFAGLYAHSPRWRRLVWTCRAMATSGVALVGLITSWIIFRMAVPVPLPVTEMPEPNAYQAIRDLPPEWSDYDFARTDAFVQTDEGKVLKPEHAESLVRVRRALASPGKVILTTDALADMNYASKVRSITAILNFQATKASLSQRVEIGRDLLRLGQYATVGGTYLDRIMGHTPTVLGVDLVARERHRLDRTTCESLLQELLTFDAAWEDEAVVAKRDAAHAMHWANWSSRLCVMAEALAGTVKDAPDATLWTNRRARIRLLQTELALRLYYLDQQAWPDTLDALAPQYLPAVPLDPYVNRPLIYRRAGEGYSLYSVADNQVDDGGVYPGALAMMLGTPGDLHVDAYSVDVPQTPPASSPP